MTTGIGLAVLDYLVLGLALLGYLVFRALESHDA